MASESTPLLQSSDTATSLPPYQEEAQVGVVKSLQGRKPKTALSRIACRFTILMARGKVVN